MAELILTPELNYWMIRVLQNSPVNETFHKIPSDIDSVWRENDSVIELLFNENFNPDPDLAFPDSSSSSSSGSIIDEPTPEEIILAENDKRYIYLYRRVNLLKITDDKYLRRIQTYRWTANTFVANSPAFLNMFDLTGTIFDNIPPDPDPSERTIGSLIGIVDSERVLKVAINHGDGVESSGTTTPVLDFDVNEAERSPHITYKTKNFVTSNYPLVKNGDIDPLQPLPEPPLLGILENIFDFSDDDHLMLDLLYDYKIKIPIDLSVIDFNDLTTPLAKLIYIYLDAYVNCSFEFYNNEENISNGENILVTLYEKVVIDMVYILQQKLYGVVWKPTCIVNEKFVEIDEDIFITLEKQNVRVLVTPEIATSGEIIIDENMPWNRKDFTLFRDGLILQQDRDYKMEIDVTDVRAVFFKVSLIGNTFAVGECIELIWSYANPHTLWDEDGHLVDV